MAASKELITHPAKKYGFNTLESAGKERSSNVPGTPVVYRYKADGHLIELKYSYQKGWDFGGYYLDGEFISCPISAENRKDAEETFFYDAAKRLKSTEVKEKEPIMSNHIKTEISTTINLILYGPPGTGKTYKLQQLFGKYTSNADQEPQETKPQTLNQGEAANHMTDNSVQRYDFITFHQSYSYEEFIEGIRPVMDDLEGTENEIAYRIYVAGI
jgi:hypothetical protein